MSIEPKNQADQASNKSWVERWKKVGPELDRIRQQELRDFCYEDNRAAIDSLLQLGIESTTLRNTSGLVEQQRLFRKLWKKTEAE